MSGNQWPDDDFSTDEDGFNTEDSGGVAQLRRQYKAMLKENKEKDAEIKKLQTQSRTATVKEILRAKNVNPKLAALIPADVEVTEDAISAWLEEFGDVFNVKGSAPEGGGPAQKEGQAEPAYSKDDVTALNKVAAASQGATVDTTKTQELIGQVQSAKTQEDFLSLMAQHGVGTNTAGG